MNAKKISALVLAAVMAAGTTTVAFARANEDYPLDIPDRQWENVYVEKDGVLKEVQKGDVVTPGTTLYIRLDEYSKAETKDKNKSKVWAEWKVGKDMVEDVDIVYKKGEFYTNIWSTDRTFTVDGVDFTIPLEKVPATDVDLQNMIAGMLKDYHDNEDKNFLADEAWDQFRTYIKRNAYVDGTNYYESAADLLAAKGFEAGEWFSDDGISTIYTDGQLTSFLTNKGATAARGTFYVSPATVSAGFGTWSSSQNPGDVQGVAADWQVVTLDGTSYVIDTSKVTTMSELKAAGYNALVEYNYKDASRNYYADENAALASVNGFSVKDVYVLPNSTTTVSKEVAWDAAVEAACQIAADMTQLEVGTSFDTEYTYWVAIDTKDDDTTALLDLAGSIYVGTTKSKAYDNTPYDLDFTFSNRVDDYSDADVVEDEYTFKPDSRAVVKFAKDAEDVVLYFGTEEDIWYEFDARGQSALNFAFTFDYNREIAADYPEANIDFITWTAQPSTNRTGTLYITADPDSFIYEISEDGKTLKEVANAEYNEDEEAWEIRTRKLVGYAISDKELDLVEDTTSSSTGSETGSNNGGKDNPDTGR